MIRLIFTLAINLLISLPTFALVVDQKEIKFTAKTETLLKGDVQYALDVLSKRKFNTKYPELQGLDSLGIMQEPNVRIIIAKTAYIVEKPVGFFDHLNTVDEKFIGHVLGEQSVKKMSENTFKVKVPGASGYSYKIKTYFDSDDISTLPNSKVVRAVTQARKMDVISQSASSTTYKELTKFSKYFVGGIQVSSFIPIKENKTLVLNYSLFAVKKYYALEKLIRKSVQEEAMAQKDLINSY
jgi:hypothetical protein